MRSVLAMQRVEILVQRAPPWAHAGVAMQTFAAIGWSWLHSTIDHEKSAESIDDDAIDIGTRPFQESGILVMCNSMLSLGV